MSVYRTLLILCNSIDVAIPEGWIQLLKLCCKVIPIKRKGKDKHGNDRWEYPMYPVHSNMCSESIDVPAIMSLAVETVLKTIEDSSGRKMCVGLGKHACSRTFDALTCNCADV